MDDKKKMEYRDYDPNWEAREKLAQAAKGDPKKILPQDVARSENEKKKCGEPCPCDPSKGEACDVCGGRGTAVMRGTYVGDTEGQHGVCKDCAGTGWKAGPAWLARRDELMAEYALKDQGLRKRYDEVYAKENAHAADKKMAERAMEMLKGLDAREKALGDGASDLHKEQEKHRLRVLAHDNDVKTGHEGVAEAQADLEAAKLELEEMRESIRKPLKKLVREVAEMREEMRAGK